jgi:hypothetical protein
MNLDELKKIPVPDELKKELHSVEYVLDNSNYRSLVLDVLEQLGFDSSEDYYQIQNCYKHGADGGVNGFIYYNEVIDFVKNNQLNVRKYIEEFCEETDSMGREYRDEAVMIILENSSVDSENEDEFNDFMEDVEPMYAGMCYGFLQWSPFFKNDKNDTESFIELYEFFANNKIPDGSVSTFLAWFALEGVCREFEKND